MLIEVLMVAGVVLIALPALVVGARRVTYRGTRALRPTGPDRAEFVVFVIGRVLGLLLLATLSAVVLVASIGGLIKGLTVPDLVYVFFTLDLLMAALVVLTVGARPRPARRSGTPARR